MIVYEATKSQFLDHILNDQLTMEIYNNYRKKIGKTSKSEIRSWDNSMQYMYKVLQTDEIQNQVLRLSIKCQQHRKGLTLF